ncbi:hypothetical protein NN561_001117 [Cricetulus griseus]
MLPSSALSPSRISSGSPWRERRRAACTAANSEDDEDRGSAPQPRAPGARSLSRSLARHFLKSSLAVGSDNGGAAPLRGNFRPCGQVGAETPSAGRGHEAPAGPRAAVPLSI